MRHLVILNPAAGKGAAGRREVALRRFLDQAGIDYLLERTEGPMHARELAQSASGYDVVVAAGGDGTCNEVVNGLMALADGETRPALGVLCIGRGNDFAFGVGIPHDLEEGVRVLSQGHRGATDVGRLWGCGSVDGRYFCNGLGIGFDTIVGLEAARMAHVGSFLGYVLGALKTILTFPEPPLVSLRWKTATIEQEATQISLMIGRRMGGAFYMCPRALPDDGALDLCIANHVTRGQMVGLFMQFLRGTQEGSPHIAFERSEAFEVSALRGSLLVHADGETICTDGKQLRAECVPRALEVVTRPRDGRADLP